MPTKKSILVANRAAAEKERISLKKKNLEERKAEEASKKAEEARLLAEAIESNKEWSKAKELKEKETIEATANAKEVGKDIPDVNINNHLTSLNDTDHDESSPQKSKRRTSSYKSVATLKSSLKTPKFSIDKNHEHQNKFTLITAAVTMSSDDPVVAFVGSIRLLVKDIMSVDPVARLINLYDRGKNISDSAMVPINQTALGAFVKISTYGDKNPLFPSPFPPYRCYSSCC